MKTFTRLFALLLVLVMALSMTAMAADTFTDATTGSITIHKYELNRNAGEPATGLETSTLPEGATPLAGVTFTAYQVVDAATLKAYYDGTADDATEATITAAMANPSSLYTESNGTYTVNNINDTAVTGTSKTTDANGEASFTSLPLGLYLIIETDAPDKVVTTQAPFLVSLPMTVNNEWLYDVHVYPKNSTSEGNVTLTKQDASGSPLAGVTFKLEKQEDAAWTAVGENLTTTASGVITWSALTHGEYQITEISAPEGYIVDSTPIAFTVNTDNTIVCNDERDLLTGVTFNTTSKTLSLTLKNEKPTVDKTITSGANSSSVGETVSYEVTTTVPTEIIQMSKYVLSDAPTGLSVTENTIKVQVDNADVSANCYTTTVKDGAFTITFKTPLMSSYAGKTLTVTYDATVTTAAASSNKATNTVTLTYSDKLVSATDEATTTDTTESNLYTATITKKLDSETGSAAAGVKFKAYDNANLSTALKFTKNADGSYTLDPAGSVTELVTDANGKIVINGLGKKSYYLVETETKAGYNLLSGSVEMKVGDEADFQYETTIVNKKGFNLPQTGGIGTLMFIVIGGVLMAGGICLVTTGKKRAS